MSRSDSSASASSGAAGTAPLPLPENDEAIAGLAARRPSHRVTFNLFGQPQVGELGYSSSEDEDEDRAVPGIIDYPATHQYTGPDHFMGRGPFDVPSIWAQLLNPFKLIARFLNLIFYFLRPWQPKKRNITVVCMSDTHNRKPKSVPFGDVLIHAGDLSQLGTKKEIQRQIDWLNSLPHEHKVVIAGNHDTLLDPRSRQTLDEQERDLQVDWHSLIYLQDSSTTLYFPTRGERGQGCKLRIYGAPHIPECGGPEHAFQEPRTTDMWSGRVPAGTNIVVSHTPPRCHLDLPGAKPLGDAYLLKELWRIRPVLHVFGHVHAARSDFFGQMSNGRDIVRWDLAERHYEGVISKSAPDGLSDVANSLADWTNYYHLAGFFLHSFRELVLERMGWANIPNGTLMVNAALMERDTGRLGNKIQVVQL